MTFWQFLNEQTNSLGIVIYIVAIILILILIRNFIVWFVKHMTQHREKMAEIKYGKTQSKIKKTKEPYVNVNFDQDTPYEHGCQKQDERTM